MGEYIISAAFGIVFVVYWAFHTNEWWALWAASASFAVYLALSVAGSIR